MKDENKSKEQLINELEELRRLIAELEKSETEHKHAEDFYRTAVEKSFAGVYIVQDGKFVFVNSNAAAYAGYAPREIIGMESFSLVHPEDREITKKCSSEMLKKQKTSPYEFRISTKYGNIRWIMETLSSIHYEGKPAILGNSMDITDLKQAEEELRESEEKYRTILEGIEDGYYEIDITGNFTFFNDSLCRILGYSRNELMGMNNRQYMDQETANKVYLTFNEVFSTGVPTKSFDWKFITRNGTKRDIEASISLMRDAKGQRIGFRGIIRDITEHKHEEKE